MEVLVILLLFAGVVIPLAVIQEQRGRRQRSVQHSSQEPSFSSALSSWESPEGSAPPPPSSGPRVAGRPLSCSHCGGTSFEERDAQLNTPVATFFNVDWANRTATCFVCTRCGHIDWFLL